MNKLNAISITFLLASAMSVEAALRSGSQYINRGAACDSRAIFSRTNGVNSKNEQEVQEACNVDPFCHGYAFLGNTFWTLDSIGGLNNFLNSCKKKGIQVKEKKIETAHATTRPNELCFDENRYGNVQTCRINDHNCDLASDDVKQDCCICGGGRIERVGGRIERDEDIIEGLVEIPGASGTFDSNTRTSLALTDRPDLFNGSIPTEIYSLTKLTTLDLSGNAYVGTIPPGIEKLTDLEELMITGNYLQGPLPEQLITLTNLQVVNIEFKGVTSDATRGVF